MIALPPTLGFLSDSTPITRRSILRERVDLIAAETFAAFVGLKRRGEDAAQRRQHAPLILLNGLAYLGY